MGYTVYGDNTVVKSCQSGISLQSELPTYCTYSEKGHIISPFSLSSVHLKNVSLEQNSESIIQTSVCVIIILDNFINMPQMSK